MKHDCDRKAALDLLLHDGSDSGLDPLHFQGLYTRYYEHALFGCSHSRPRIHGRCCLRVEPGKLTLAVAVDQNWTPEGVFLMILSSQVC